MRIFKHYAPRLIANHVISFFKGGFEVQGVGTFRFDFGKVIIEKDQDVRLREVSKEINSTILSLKSNC